MKKLMLSMILMVVITIPGLAQSLNAPLFGTNTTPVLTDTLTQADSMITSRTVEFRLPATMKGSLTLSGQLKLLTGTGVNVTVTMRMLTNDATDEYGEWHSLGTITAPTDSTAYDFNVAGQSWWTYCDGYQVKFIEASAGTYSMELKARGKSK